MNTERRSNNPETIEEGLEWIKSLANNRADFESLIIQVNMVGTLVREELTSTSTPERMNEILTIVGANDTDTHLLQFFVHALLMDRETLEIGNMNKGLAPRIDEFLPKLSSHSAEEDDSVRNIDFVRKSLLHMYDFTKAGLTESDQAALLQKVDALKKLRDEKIAKRASKRIDQIKKAESQSPLRAGLQELIDRFAKKK